MRALESRLQTYFVSLRADDPAPERDESELEALRTQVRELKAARTLAKFGFGKKRKPTKAKEDAKTLDALDAKIEAVQAELRSPRGPSSRRPRRRPRWWRSPRHLPCCHPCGACSARRSSRRRARPVPPTTRQTGRGQVGRPQVRIVSAGPGPLPADERDPPGPFFETRLLLRQTPEAGLGRSVPKMILDELEEQCLRLLDEDYGTSTEQPLSSLVEALRALRAVQDRTKARAELRLLRQRSEELRRVSTGIELYDNLCSQVDQFVDQIRKSVKRPVPAIRFSQDDLTPPHSPSRRRSFETSPPQSPTRSELSVTFRDDRFRQDRSERQQRLTEDIEGPG